MTLSVRASRTQEERTAAMRRRLLDATISSLHEKGYRGTTTMEVHLRAGVSRGALLHHFGSRAELILAAVDHLARERIAEVHLGAQAHPPDSQRIDWAVKVLWSTFEGPLFSASLELWLAARTDSELFAVLIPQERVVGRAIRTMAGELFGEEARSSPGFSETLELLLDAMRGASARSVLRTEGTDRRLMASWALLMSAEVGAAFVPH